MRMKERVTISLDKGLNKEVEKILSEMGMKTSSYINIVLRGLVDAEKQTFKKICEDLSTKIYKEMKKEKNKKES